MREAREQERLRVARTGQRLDVRPRTVAERHGGWGGLRIRETDGVLASVAPSKIRSFAAAVFGERQQADRRDASGQRASCLSSACPSRATFFLAARRLPRRLDEAVRLTLPLLSLRHGK